MKYLLNILLMGAIVGSAMAAAAAPQRVRPLTEGYLVAGVEGRVVHDPNLSRWDFYPVQPITDGKGLLPAGKAVMLLPCSVRQQMGRLLDDKRTLEVRLWAMATEYRGQNYLYSLYFLPMKKDQGQTKTDEKPQPPKSDNAGAAEDKKDAKESVLPTEILQMIQQNPVPDLQRLDELVEVISDRNLILRTGLMQRQQEAYVFSPDAFGQNVEGQTYILLPCKLLETTQRAMQQVLGRQRYVVSGVTTDCDGQSYLLPRRAVRTYTHGNFTP